MLKAAFLSLIGMMASVTATAADGTYALINAQIFNGTDNQISKHSTILVKDGLIARLLPQNATIPEGYDIIDVEGQFLMPGLFDVHTHIDTIDRAKRALESGVTTVRSASTTNYQDVALRELVRTAKLPGPEVLAAGVYVTPNLGKFSLADPRLAALYDGVKSDDDLRQLIAINADRGVDVIKARGTERAGLPDTDPRQQSYSERQLRIIVEEAAKHDLPVLVHAHGDEGARAAVLAGARSIEHGTYLSKETLELMVEKGTWFVPTHVTMQEMSEERYHYVLRLRGKHMVPQLERAMKLGYKLGVKFATGADNYYQEDSINRIATEIQAFEAIGMSRFDALQAGTVRAAALLRVDDRTGRIAEGFEADIIAVPGNPLDDLQVLDDILMVISNGHVVLKRFPFATAD